MEVTAEHLKAAVMCYLRFERLWIAATEVNYSEMSGIADILCDTGTEIIEVETKVSKSDLLDLELQKKKHDYFKSLTGDLLSKHVPNKFYICVPKNLARIAERFIQDVNPGYGLMVFDTREEKIHPRALAVKKHPTPLHNGYDSSIRNLLVMRLCSEVTNFYLHKANSTFQRSLRHSQETNTEGNSSGRKKGYRRPSGILEPSIEASEEN
jgi:hypothetical protein